MFSNILTIVESIPSLLHAAQLIADDILVHVASSQEGVTLSPVVFIFSRVAPYVITEVLQFFKLTLNVLLLETGRSQSVQTALSLLQPR
jgi:hypothetical protein